MMNKYGPGDYQARLHNTIVRYRDTPVSLQVLDADTFRISPIHPKSAFKGKNIRPDDVLLDISTPPLGYINFMDGDGYQFASYLMREPVRRFQQGLSSRNTTTHLLTGERHRRVRDRIEYLYSEGYENLCLGVYPKFEQALSLLENDKTGRVYSYALNKNIAILKAGETIKVYFKLDEVGYIVKGSRTVRVPHDENSKIISSYLNGVGWVVD